MKYLRQVAIASIIAVLLVAKGIAQVGPEPPIAPVMPIVQAIELNMAEVQLGQLAVAKGQNAAVKQFANMVVTDHGDALAKLRALKRGTNNAGERLSPQHQAAFDRLSQLTGREFDRQFMEVMVHAQQESLFFFEFQSTQTGSDPELAKIALELVPIIRKHLQEAEVVQQDLKRNPNEHHTIEINDGDSVGRQ